MIMSSIKRPCNAAGCGTLIGIREKYCPAHASRKRVKQPFTKRSSTADGYGYQWQKARRVFLLNHPLCVECERQGYINAATVVDHITPHKGDRELFWNQRNWQPLCKRHHSQKTAREDGGFGNPNGGSNGL